MKTFTILHIEDDDDDRHFVSNVFNNSGYDLQIVEAHDGREAIHYLSSLPTEKKPDLILLDLNLPILDGREMLAILKSEPVTASIPVVAFTTSSSDADEKYCKQFQVDMLTKPFSHRDAKEILNWIITNYYQVFKQNLSS